MPLYRIAGQEINISCPVSELEPYLISDAQSSVPVPLVPSRLVTQAVGWVGNAQRAVEVWTLPPGHMLSVDGARSLYIAPRGEALTISAGEWTDLERETLLGPGLVLALAARGTWSLHASAALRGGEVTLFLGESGQGKSTLAAYLSTQGQRGWLRVADDILPVTAASSRVEAWPHFPQLKLASESQPGLHLPERMPVTRICLLTNADRPPALKPLPPNESAQALLRHTAGTRLLPPPLLAEHLAFVAQAVQWVPVFELSYPRRMDALESVMEILESAW